MEETNSSEVSELTIKRTESNLCPSFNCSKSVLDLYKCSHCLFQHYLLIKLKNHASPHNKSFSSTTYNCKKCQFETNSFLILYKHVADLCRARKWFGCDQCSYTTSNSLNLTKHKKYHTSTDKITWFKCDHCQFRSKWKGHVKRHNHARHVIRGREEIKCRQCPFRTIHTESIRRHVIARHETNIQWFNCDICSFRTKRKDRMKPHKRRIHGMFTYSFSRINQIRADEWFQCDECTYRTDTNVTLRMHKLMRHVTKGGTVPFLRCFHCPYQTDSDCALKEHVSGNHRGASVVL